MLDELDRLEDMLPWSTRVFQEFLMIIQGFPGLPKDFQDLTWIFDTFPRISQQTCILWTLDSSYIFDIDKSDRLDMLDYYKT